MKNGLWAVILAGTLALLGGCQTTHRHNQYAELVNRPMPASDRDRDQECSWLRSEVARQQSLAQYGTSTATTPQMAVLMQSVARKNIANLQSRYSQIQCDVTRVAPTAPVVPQQPPSTSGLTFDECFAKCRSLTSRTENECFDSCRH